MPINLCCDVCQGFIKHISVRDAQDMMRRKEPTVCVVCQTVRDKFRKSCERVLVQLQRESEKIKAGVESQFLDVMKEAIEGSINQVAKGEKDDTRQNGETVDSKGDNAGSSSSEVDETETEEESTKESVG